MPLIVSLNPCSCEYSLEWLEEMIILNLAFEQLNSVPLASKYENCEPLRFVI